MAALAAAPSGASLPPAQDILLEQFAVSAFNFLDASASLWTDDKVIAQLHGEWKAASDAGTDAARVYCKRMYDKFQDTFGKYTARILAKDETVFAEDVPELKAVNALAKWSESNEGTRETIWEYLKQIAQSASVSNIYDKCPKEVLDVVTNMASSMMADVEKGSFDPSSIDPMAISQKLMGALKPDDIKAWGQRLTSEGGLEAMMTMMGTVMSSAGGPAGMDFGALTGAFGGQGGMGAIMQGLQAAASGGNGGMPNIDALGSLMSQFGGSTDFTDMVKKWEEEKK